MMADIHGRVVILKDNKPKYLLIGRRSGLPDLRSDRGREAGNYLQTNYETAQPAFEELVKI